MLDMFTTVENSLKVSLIVPVYNMESYIQQCLDSLIAQTYQDFELIIVDDGSTDQSGEICERYQSKFQNVNIIHKKNEGLIIARIEGLRKAKCKYITFVDADDWIDADFLELLVTKIEENQADMVAMGYVKEEKTRTEKVLNFCDSGIYERKDLVDQIFPRMLYFKGFFEFGILPYIWNKIYKKDMLLNCYKRINTNINIGEDVAVVYPYLLQTNKIVICEEAKYHYRRHNQSMTAEKKQDFYANAANLYLYLYNEFQKTAFFECMLKQLDQYLRMVVWNRSPECFIEANKNIFPFGKVPKGANIILYAAGDVGKRYYNQIQRTGYCHLTAWVDAKYDSEKLKGLGVESIDVITKRQYDYLVIAIESVDIANQIREMLVEMGVDDSKIIQNEEVANGMHR